MRHRLKVTLPQLIPCLYTICITCVRFSAQALCPLGLASLICISSGPVHAATAPIQTLSAPAKAAKTFDSLLNAGKLAKAKSLCTGQVLRMFDFIALSQSKMADAVDTTLSTDTTLEERMTGEGGSRSWAYLKTASHIVFKRPMMGLSEIHSIQAIHLYHSPRGWLVAEFEELNSKDAPVRLRAGMPDEDLAKRETNKGPSTPNLFPVSEKAPATAGEIDRMQYRIRLKNGGSLAPYCTLGPEQRLIRQEPDSSWILENTRATLHPVPAPVHAPAPVPVPAAEGLPASFFQAHLAPNAFLILDDTLLIKTAARIGGSEKDPAQITSQIYSWVSENLKFKLGTVLFGTSHDVLRSLTGDCSEAAILTAALLRARGIPSRLVFGFASMGRGVFIGHAWTEAFLKSPSTEQGTNKPLGGQGKWVGVDAALKQFPAGVERVKLLELSGETNMRIAATNLMIAVLANLDIEILAAWKDGKPVPLQSFPGNAGEGTQFLEEILKGIGDF